MLHLVLLLLTAEVPPAGTSQKVIQLMEWTLETSLTPEERAEFEQNQRNSWPALDSQARKNLLTLAQTQEALAALPVSQRAELRKKMKAMLLETLRQQPENSGSKLLLAAYERSRGAGAGSAPGPAPGKFPAELVGEWSSVHTSSVNFVNPNNGSYAPPSGNGMQYKFFPDGRFQSAGLIQSSLYNCTTTVNAFEEGRVEIRGNVMIFRSQGGTLESKDNCNASSNYRKTLPANDTTYKWRVERDQWGTKFCIVREGMSEDCAYRK